ncbi:MAG TPA: diguanylate cyclase, partial [Pseudomonadales bacterium]|nr:diguanylate cyclase [Pseudomonadales bacterium]
EVILLSLALADRLNQEKRQRLDAQVKALENERLARQSQYEALKHERKANEAQAAALEIQKQATETLEARVKERTEELEKVNEQLEMMSITDSLTNIRNRRYFDRTLKLEMARAIRQKQSISVLIIDIDYFKGVNDSYGHQAGDEVLKGIANSLSKTINRSTDLLARFGGEEFVVILPDTTPEGAVHVADCILKEIAQLRFDEISAGLKITASIGIYGDVPTHGSSHDTWVCNADDALYYAKNNGRNQVVSFAQISAAKAQIE